MKLWERNSSKSIENDDASYLASLRRAKIRSIANLTPVMISANFSMLLLVIWMYADRGSTPVKAVWAGALLLALTYYFSNWRTHRRNRQLHLSGSSVKSDDTTGRMYYGLHFLAFSHGVLWGGAALYFGSIGIENLQTPLWVGLATILMASGVWLAAVPTAVVAFVLPMAAGSAATLAMQSSSTGTTSLWLLLLWLSLATPLIAKFYAKLFSSHVSSMESAKEQSGLVMSLLDELEENSSNWVWETDVSGNIIRFPNEMMPEKIEDTPLGLLDHMRRIATIKGAQLDDLEAALFEKAEFKDIVLCISVGSGESWLRLSGHPTFDKDGTFNGFVGSGSDVTSEKLAEDRIVALSQSDTLTGLMNRSAFSDRLSQAVANLERYGRPFTVLYLDIDHFKLINDTRGHMFGDRLLAEASERISEEVREGDCVARLGGDEFAILMDSQGDAGQSARLAARLIGEVSKPYSFESQEFKVGLSVGIAMAPLNGTRPDQLLRNADLALYRAKADGRGVFRFFENNMDSEMREKRMLEAELRDACSNDELVLHFQPLVDAKSRATLGMESLIRWQHPIRGLLAPSEFIELAEHANLIAEIGTWTLNKACQSAVHWPNDTFVAVNLSAHHFVQADIVSEVHEALTNSGLSPHRLELEITESLLINNTNEVIAKLERIKELGVSVAMDDFGTGYSSLSYLMSVPFDKLKIDKSFVDEVADNEAGQKIVRMITTLANELSLKITAEGVEEEVQADFLANIGCDMLQGYLFSKPISEQDLAGYFLSSVDTRKPSSNMRSKSKLKSVNAS